MMNKHDVRDAWETLVAADKLGYILDTNSDVITDWLLQQGNKGWCKEVRECIAENSYKDFEGNRELWFVYILCKLTDEMKIYATVDCLYDEELEDFEDWEYEQDWKRRYEIKQQAFEKYGAKTPIQQLLFEYGIKAAREYIS